ncbi:STAS domain-containing protein [Candidatus Woesearchaeota archaeon]|nr:STAS domain-containing protein [Candidatus Woesearchaeota archaeon]
MAPREYKSSLTRYVIEGPYKSSVGDVSVLRCEGFMDPHTLDKFEEELMSLVSRKEHAVLDMAKVLYLASAVAGAMVSNETFFRDDSLEILLIGMQPQVARVFEVLSLDKVFAAYATIDEALKEEDPTKRAVLEAVKEQFGA